MTKKSAFALAAIFAMNYISAQELVGYNKPKSQFSFGLLTGFNKTHFTPNLDGEPIESSLGYNSLIRFAYRYRLDDKLYAEAGFNIGFQNERSNPPLAEYQGFRNSLVNGFYFNFARLDLLAAYEVYGFKNNSINALGGLGVNSFGASYTGSVSSSESGYFELNYDIKNEFTYFTNFGIEFTSTNKRQDELSFRLLYNFGFSSYVDGNYILSNNGIYSDGSFKSMLRGFNFGFNYTFTGIKKSKRLLALMSDYDWSKKEAKRKHKFEKRAIDPKSQFVYVGFGFGANTNRFSPKNDPFSSPNFLSFSTRLSYEHGWKNNIFFEADYTGFSFWEGAMIKHNSTSSSAWGGDAFYGHFLTAGLQYKIQNPKTNFQFFNVHGGIGLGAHFSPKGLVGSGSGGGNSDSYTYNYNSISDVRGNLMPVIYGGISKDVRITEHLSINFMYKHQLGFINVYSTTYEYSGNNSPTPQTINAKIDGTAFLIQMGFKYRIK